MQQNMSSRTLRRVAAVAIAAGALAVAAPLTVRAVPGLQEDPPPMLADTGASGREPAILTAGVAMLIGGTAVVGVVRFRTARATGDLDEDDWDDGPWDDEDTPEAATPPPPAASAEPAAAEAPTTQPDEPVENPTPGNAATGTGTATATATATAEPEAPGTAAAPADTVEPPAQPAAPNPDSAAEPASEPDTPESPKPT